MPDRRFGAKPSGSSSAAAIVRFGFTRDQRMLVARRDRVALRELAMVYDQAFVNELCALCDRFAERKRAA
jgi:hypothetical protein